MSTTILYPACIAVVCDHGKRLMVEDCRECEALSDRAHEEIHEYWLLNSGGGFYVQQ